MPSQIAWLDASAAEQRRMREIINLFTERASLDDLGLGQVRDAVADGLFPGTSTLLTRARYALFIPWCYQEAAHHRNVAARPTQADRLERDVIEALRGTGERGLIGAQAGRAVKNLPSVLYWSFLRHYRLLTDPTLDRPDAAEGLAPTTLGGAEVGVWTSSLPEAPADFPQHVPGGFAMTRDEASWLQERVLQSAPDTLFAHLVLDRPLADSSFPWEDPAALTSRGLAGELLRDAKHFSVVMHGAQLLYNLLLAERYEQRGFTGISISVESYRGALENWQQVELPSLDLHAWEVDGLLTRCDVIRGALIGPLAVLPRPVARRDGPRPSAAQPVQQTGERHAANHALWRRTAVLAERARVLREREPASGSGRVPVPAAQRERQRRPRRRRPARHRVPRRRRDDPGARRPGDPRSRRGSRCATTTSVRRLTTRSPGWARGTATRSHRKASTPSYDRHVPSVQEAPVTMTSPSSSPSAVVSPGTSESPGPPAAEPTTSRALGRLVASENSASDLLALLIELDDRPVASTFGLGADQSYNAVREWATGAGRIDVMITDHAAEKPVAAIEMKGASSIHGDQLERYENWAKSRPTPPKLVFCAFDADEDDLSEGWNRMRLRDVYAPWQHSEHHHAAWLATEIVALMDRWDHEAEGPMGMRTGYYVPDIATKRMARELRDRVDRTGRLSGAYATRDNGGSPMAVVWIAHPHDDQDSSVSVGVDLRSPTRRSHGSIWKLRPFLEVERTEQRGLAESQELASRLAHGIRDVMSFSSLHSELVGRGLGKVAESLSGGRHNGFKAGGAFGSDKGLRLATILDLDTSELTRCEISDLVLTILGTLHDAASKAAQ